MFVNAISGQLDTSKLGFTLMHEHIVLLSPGVRENWPSTFDEAALTKRAISKLRAAKANGIDTLVDLTTVDLGRDVPLVASIARKVGIQVVVATGLHLRIPTYFLNREVNHIADLFVQDIERGVQGTEIKAGVVKIACDDPVVAGPFELSFRAGARAHRRTGVPISTHTRVASKSGLDHQRILAEEGVDLTRVIIGHSGDSEDLDYLQALLDRGSTLGMDRFGLDKIAGVELLDTPKRVKVVAELCKRGYAGQLVLGHDTNCYSMSWSVEQHERNWPNWHFVHIPRDVIPMLKESGVSQADIDTMTRHNPRKIFETQGAY
jgi:phosphotriesterase-related protein